jgi:hypothetical protein
MVAEFRQDLSLPHMQGSQEKEHGRSHCRRFLPLHFDIFPKYLKLREAFMIDCIVDAHLGRRNFPQKGIRESRLAFGGGCGRVT